MKNKIEIQLNKKNLIKGVGITTLLYASKKNMKNSIYLFIILILLSCTNSKNKNYSEKELLEKNSIKSIYLKTQLYSNDSIALNTEQVEYFIKQWNDSKPIGMRKYIPKIWIKVNFNNAKNKYFKNSGKLIKSNNDFTFQLNDTVFLKSILQSRLKDNKKENKLELKIFELNKHTVFTGQTKLKNGKTFTTGIEFKKISENMIEYQYTELINWKQKERIKGVGILTGKGKIKDRYNREFETVILKDSTNLIEIHFTTKKPVLSRIFRKKSDNSPLMYGK